MVDGVPDNAIKNVVKYLKNLLDRDCIYAIGHDKRVDKRSVTIRFDSEQDAEDAVTIINTDDKNKLNSTITCRMFDSDQLPREWKPEPKRPQLGRGRTMRGHPSNDEKDGERATKGEDWSNNGILLG